MGREPIKYHICIKMPSPGSPRRARYFGDSYLKAVEVWALHAGIAPWHRLHYLWASSLFYWFTGAWGAGGRGRCSSHQCCSNDVCLMMSQDSWGREETQGKTDETRNGGRRKGAGGVGRVGDDITWGVEGGCWSMKLYAIAAGLKRCCMSVSLWASLPLSYQ